MFLQVNNFLELLTRDALQGNLDDVRVSLETNYMQVRRLRNDCRIIILQVSTILF